MKGPTEPAPYRGIVATIDREESLVAERGLVAWLMRRGLVWLSSSADAWLLGWEHNPLLRHVVRRHGATTVAIFTVMMALQKGVQMLVPWLNACVLDLVVTWASLLMATTIATHWHTRAVRPLYNEQLRMAPLTPAELVQGLALPPAAIAIGLLTPYLVVDVAWWAAMTGGGSDAIIEFVAIGVVLRVFLFFLLLPTLERIAESAAVAAIASRSGFGAAARHTMGASLASARYLLLAVVPMVVLVAMIGLFGMVGAALKSGLVATLGGCGFGLVAAIWTARVAWQNFVVGRLDERSTALDHWLASPDTWPLLAGEEEPLTMPATEGWLGPPPPGDARR